MTDETTDVAPDENELEAFRQWQRDKASPEAQEMAAKGASATHVDLDEMLAQMQKMQARIDSLSAAQGIPADPTAAAIKNLQVHAQARADMHPTRDFSKLLETVDNIADDPTTKDTDYVATVVRNFVKRSGTIAHDLAYVEQLADDLHEHTLEKAAA